MREAAYFLYQVHTRAISSSECGGGMWRWWICIPTILGLKTGSDGESARCETVRENVSSSLQAHTRAMSVDDCFGGVARWRTTSLMEPARW